MVKEAESSGCLAAKIAKLEGKPKQAYENSVIKLYFRWYTKMYHFSWTSAISEITKDQG